jgi:hypothetical protein
MSWSKLAAPAMGDDNPLDVVDSDWVRVYGSGRIIVRGGAVDRLEGESLNIVHYRYAGDGSPTGDQLIRMRVHTGTTTEEHFQPMVRVDASGNGYLATWRPVSNFVRLFRYVAGGSSSILETANVTLSTNTTYEVTLKVTGTNPCIVTVSDDVNGELISYEDSNASRLTTGYPGIYWNAAGNLKGSASPAWADDLDIEDWSTGAGVSVLAANFTQFAWSKLSPP